MKAPLFTLALVLISFSIRAQDVIPVPKTQQSLVTKLTATWCPICGGSAWDTQKKFVSQLSKDALVLAAHISSSSRLYSPTAEILLKNFDLATSQPVFFYNTSRIGTGGTTTENTITTNVQNAAKVAPTLQTGILACLNPSSRELVVESRTEFFKSIEGTFTISYFLVEDSVIAEQSARSGSEIHRNVLRTSLIPEVYGQALASGGIAEGTFVQNRIAYQIPTTFNSSKIRVAAVVWKKNGTKYDFVNLNVVPVSAQTVTSVQADQQLSQGFAVYPNQLIENGQIALELQRSYPKVSVDLIDLLGRPVKTLFAGALSAGQHTFQMSRSDFEGSGTFFVRVSTGDAQAVRPVFVFKL